MEIETLIQTVNAYTQSTEVKPVLEEAFRIASEAHGGFLRISGKPFLSHPLAVASRLAEWHAPLPVVTVGLLHDIHNPDYSLGCDLDLVHQKLGPTIFQLLHSMIELNSFIRQVERDLYWDVGTGDAEYHISSMLHKGHDILVIKVADRLHNLQEISFLTREFQERTARIAFNLLAPLADKLGMFIAKNQLEDYGFSVQQPMYYQMFKEYAEVLNHEAVENIVGELQHIIEKAIPETTVCWQPFPLYNLYYRQVEQNAKLGRPVHTKPASLLPVDAGNFVVLLNDEIDCYRVLGTLHKLFPPIAHLFRDHIGDPKSNGYRSLNTRVKHPSGVLLNVIIRTRMMHLVAERGITARWWNVPEELLPQLPQKVTISSEPIQILTTSGETKHFPSGATLLDFAYSIHSDLGHQCIGALVNGEHAKLDQQMKTGERIEIIFGESEVGPNLSWLEYVRTPLAAGRIRQWLTQHKRKEMVEHGRELLNVELQKLNVTLSDPQVRQLLMQLALKEHVQSLEDFFVSVGVGRHKVSRIVAQLRAMKSLSQVSALSPQENVLPKFLARCCKPVPPGDIVGHHRRDQVLVIHTRDCSQVRDLKELVVVKWDEPAEANYVVVIEARNRPHLASDLSNVVSLLNYDMLRFSSSRRAGGAIADTYIYLGKTKSEEREQIKKALNNISGVLAVEVFHTSQLELSNLSPILKAVTSELARDPNPYGPNIAIGPRFYGREVECQHISSLLQNRVQNSAILLWGQKRIGKSSLLHHLEAQSQGRFLPVFIDMQELRDSNTIHFMHLFMRHTHQILKDKFPELVPEVTVPKLNTFKKEPLTHFDAFLSFVQDITRSYSLVIILDEFQCLCSLREVEVSRDAIFSRLRSNAQHGHGMHLVLSGGGLRSYLTNQCGISSLFTIMDDEKLGCLKEDDASQLIRDGLSKVWTVHEDAIQYLFDITAGHPYYLQLLCSRLYEQTREGKGSFTRDRVAIAVQKWLKEADDSRFLHLWEAHDAASTQRNKLILSAIAYLSIDRPNVHYEQIARLVHPLLEESELTSALHDLADLGLGVLHHNQLEYFIVVKIFSRWLHQHWPYTLVVKEFKHHEHF